MKDYYVYIMSNSNKTLYIGVTNNLVRRVHEHKQGLIVGFTKKYKLKKLVFFETTESIESAIAREKQLKNWHRSWKLNLVRKVNPKFEDLYYKILDSETSSE